MARNDNCRMEKDINPTLATNVALLTKGKAIGRLREEMKQSGFDIGQGTLSRLQKGETGVRLDSLQKFADFFRVGVEALLNRDLHDGDSSEFLPVSRLSVDVGAGSGKLVSVIEHSGVLQFRRDFLRAVGVSAINAALVNVVGTSMEPTIADGSLLLINRADKEPRTGQIYAFSWHGEMLVKRFSRDGNLWIAASDNPDKTEHPDIKIDGSGASVIEGRAVWAGSRL